MVELHLVSVVFHVAAVVNFNESLKDALEVNVNGTQEVIKLCKSINNLQAFVHVSTAFSNADRNYIEEKIYFNSVPLEDVRQIAEKSSDDENTIKALLGNKPNTYTFTKAYAEEIILNDCGDMPRAIVRPSIVISALNDPCPGWIENWNGSTGLFVGMSSGVMKVMLGRGSNVTDLVPVDIVTNLLIVAASKCERSKEVKVYNCCTGTSNPITCKGAEVITRKITRAHSLNEFPFVFMIFTKSIVLYTILAMFLQIIPSFLIDLWALINGKKAIHMKTQQKINKIVNTMKYFVVYEWKFADGNVRRLQESISEEDRRIFNFDVKSIDWEKCIESYIFGARKYLLKSKHTSKKSSS